MPRRPKVVDIQTKVETPAPPALLELLKALPASAKDRRAAARKIGLAAVRRGLLTVLSGSAPRDSLLDDHFFQAACDLLETLGPGKDRRFLALARSGRFDDDRSSRILRAVARTTPADEEGRANVAEFGRLVMPSLRDLLLLPGGLDTMAATVRAHGGLAMFLEIARCEVGVPVRKVWEPVLRDPELAEHVRSFAVETVAIEGTPDARALLADLLPTLSGDLRRRALVALNHSRVDRPATEAPPSPGDFSMTLRRPELHFSGVDARGDVAITSADEGMDGGTTVSWLVVRLGAGIRRGGVRTNLGTSESYDLLRDHLGYALEGHYRPAIGAIVPILDEARRARPAARFSHDTQLALQLVDREIAYGKQEARVREPFDAGVAGLDPADLDVWRRVLSWSKWLGSWFLDDGDLAALGVDKPAVSGLGRVREPSGLDHEASRAFYRAETLRRHAAVPKAWVEDVLGRLPGTPLLPRLVRQLRFAAFTSELAGRSAVPELLTGAAGEVERLGPAAPIVRAWVERSLFPDLEDDVTCIEGSPREYLIRPMVAALADGPGRRRAPIARTQRALQLAMQAISRAEATQFAEDRPTWDEAVFEAWEATAPKRR